MENDDVIKEFVIFGVKTSKIGNEKIGKQMEKCVVKIIKGKGGSGFFLEIPNKKNGKKILVLITNNHVIEIDDVKNEDTLIDYCFDNGEKKNFKMKGRKRYSNEIYDITIIEMLDSDNLKDENFLELDDEVSFDNIDNEEIFKKQSKNYYQDSPVYCIGFPKVENVMVSFGKTLNVTEDSYELPHSCDTEPGSSGSPILSIKSNKVFAVHFGSSTNFKKNLSVIIFPAINDLINNKNKLILIYDPNKKENQGKNNKDVGVDGNKDEKSTQKTSISNYTNYMIIKYKIKKSTDRVKIFGRKFIENNKSNCQIIINNNNKQLPLSEYISVNSSNEYETIKLIEINPIKDMSYMFGKFYHDEDIVPITELTDISHWSTKGVTNMSKLFCECNELISIPDLQFWNTQNVKDMSFLFFGCEKLEKIEGISNWITDNVENMSNMFAYCERLNSKFNLSKWNTEKVKDFSYMFYECNSVTVLEGIEFWEIKSLKNYNYFLFGCNSLKQKPSISSRENSIK